MRTRNFALLLVALALSALPSLAFANPRLVSVTPVDGGCIAGPTVHNNNESWDVETSKTYTLTIDNVTECSGPTINLVVQNWYGFPEDFVATMVSPGVYSFQYTVPLQACFTAPIRICTTSALPGAGVVVGRHDTGEDASHLRFSMWGVGCTNPVPITCPVVPARTTTWGSIKTIYR